MFEWRDQRSCRCRTVGLSGEFSMNKDKSERGWARSAIQAAGLRATPARLATLLVLRETSSPLTHAEVFERLADHEIDKTTVFRNLSDLVSAGLLRRTELGDHVWRFEFVSEEEQGHTAHPHFVCVDCGNVSCLGEIELTKRSKSASEQFGQVTEILLRGHCHDCQ
jgi:Fur family ferric uptake transcriptional regulator